MKDYTKCCITPTLKALSTKSELGNPGAFYLTENQ